MSTHRKRWALALCAVVAAGAWLLCRPGQGSRAVPVASPRAAEVQTLAEELDALRQEVARLRSSQRQLADDLVTLARAVPSAPPLAAATRPREDGPAAEGKGSVSEAVAEELQIQLDQQLDREPRDPAWGQATERTIAQAVAASPTAGTRMLSAACHSTLCRIELVHDSAEARDPLLAGLQGAPPFDAESFVQLIERPNEAPRTLIYLSRPGHHLPAPPPS